VNPPLNSAASYLSAYKNSLLKRWRTAVLADENLPERRLAFAIEELDDHLPALLDVIVERLKAQVLELRKVVIRTASGCRRNGGVRLG
jgi:hypothetical protein